MSFLTYFAFVGPAFMALAGLGIYGIAVYFDRPTKRAH